MPHHCDCEVTLRGFLALSKSGKRDWFEGSKVLLVKGKGKASRLKEKAEDWPIYRKNALRSSHTTQNIKGKLKKLWSVPLGDGALTQATSAYGLVFTTEKKSNQVFALEEKTGKTRWDTE